MAEIFVQPDNPENYLTVRYQQAFWKALVEYAPGVLDYLRTHGVEAWLERYGLPWDPWHYVGKTFLERGDPRIAELCFWWTDTPPQTPRLQDYLKDYDYDPSRTTRGRWKERLMARIEQYMADVERAFEAAGWVREGVKYEVKTHSAWLAMRLDGKTYKEILEIENQKRARAGEPPLDEDTIARAIRRLAQRLGVQTRLLDSGATSLPFPGEEGDHRAMSAYELPLMLTVAELRRLIGPERLGRKAVYRLAHRYAVRIGGRFFFPRDVVLAILEGRLEDVEKAARP